MNLSTPLLLTYQDSPSSNLDYLNCLDEDAIEVYVKGYIHCSFHIQEVLVDAKRKFLDAALSIEPSSDESKELLNYVKLLDSVEDSMLDKRRVLNKYWP